MGVASTNLHGISFLRSAGLASLMVGVSISAALATSAPTYVDPAQIEKRFDDKEPAPRPASIKNMVPAEAPQSKLGKELAKKRFVLKSVSLVGNTVYSADQLKFAYEDQIGKNISMVDAQAIARRITEYYRSNEYILSQAIAVTEVKNGVLSIRVVEGYIYNVTIQGEIKQGGGRDLLKSYAESLKSKRPVKLADLERYLLLMDDLPGAKAKGVVRPSAQPGAADLVVTLTHKTFEGSYTLDNRGSEFVGPFQNAFTFTGNSLLGLYDRTLVRYINAGRDELNFYNIQHEQQISDEGTRLVFDLSHSDTHPGDALEALRFSGDSDFLQVKAVHPFLRSRQENLLARALFDVRNTETDSPGGKINEDKLRVVRAGVSYDFPDQLSGVSLIDAEISQGLGIFGASNDGDPLLSRSNGEPEFTKLSLDITRTQPIFNRFSLYTAMTSQYSFDRLLAAEQFSVGGAGFGRAYDPAEVSGDHGIAGKVEVRYGQVLNDPLLDAYQVYGFYDIGRAWLRNAGPGGNDKRSLASSGVGVRTNFSENVSGNLEVAFPLTKDPANQGTRDDDARLFFSMTGRF